ncbi:MAG: hypothetical protein QME44_07695, partial [Thermodesulfobacteriota bacterium]|nr:hypothetical protein [Thermodesulfobacteriota bacterium]
MKYLVVPLDLALLDPCLEGSNAGFYLKIPLVCHSVPDTESRLSRENGNPIHLYSSLLPQSLPRTRYGGRRLDSGACPGPRSGVRRNDTRVR